MKVAVIENHALASNTIRKELMDAITKEGHQLSILTGNSDSFKDAQARGVDMHDVGSSIQDPRDIVKHLFVLRKTLKTIKPDCVLTFTIRPAIYGNIVTRTLGYPTLSNITGIGPLFENNGYAYRAARALYKVALKKTKKIFFQNYDDLNLFVEKGYIKKENSIKIPGSGINYEKYSPRAKTVQDNKFRFLFISRLIKDKGVFEYVEAARIIKKKYPEVVVQLLGPLWLQNLKDNAVTEADLKAWKEEGCIEYLGETTDVRNFICNADCVTLPSYREGTSNVLLESASMEKPLVSCNVTGCKEIIEDGNTGFLCKARDAEDLADKMIKMYELTDQERIEMGKKGREKVIREYAKKIVIDAYLKEIKAIGS